MKLWTSRYANKELAQVPALKIRTSLGSPRFRIGYEIAGQAKSVMIASSMMKMFNPDEFEVAYRTLLDDRGVDKIRQELEELHARSNDEGLVLLCFEDLAKAPCHRRGFARWWEERTGEEIPELASSTPPSAGGGGGRPVSGPGGAGTGDPFTQLRLLGYPRHSGPVQAAVVDLAKRLSCSVQECYMALAIEWAGHAERRIHC